MFVKRNNSITSIFTFTFPQLENKLVAFQNSEGGQLNEREFKDALESLLPLSNERTRRRLYMQAEKAVRWDGIVGAVPIMRLARILFVKPFDELCYILKTITSNTSNC